MISNHLEIRQTADGSLTLFHQQIQESYHSLKGARTESEYVFIQNGLDYIHQQLGIESILILEVGFGTGLNAILSLDYAKRQNCNVAYSAIEPFPVPNNIIQQLLANNGDLLAYPFLDMHHSPWEEWTTIDPSFSLLKSKIEIAAFDSQLRFHIIYLDAFSPQNAPDIWTVEIFSKLYQLLELDGAMVTYCAKGQVKRDLKQVGFDVHTLPGACGKREMIRAIKR